MSPGPLDGEPQVVVRAGKILPENLRRDRLSRDEIESEMRLAGIGHLKEVEWAILEPKGKISFIKKSGGDSKQEDDENPAT